MLRLNLLSDFIWARVKRLVNGGSVPLILKRLQLLEAHLGSINLLGRGEGRRVNLEALFIEQIPLFLNEYFSGAKVR